jgi:hypothetical protein
MAVGGGGGLSSAALSTCLVSMYNRLPQAMHAGWYPFHCPISVSFSFSTFLCFPASWTGVDKNIRTICAEHWLNMEKLQICLTLVNFFVALICTFFKLSSQRRQNSLKYL